MHVEQARKIFRETKIILQKKQKVSDKTKAIPQNKQESCLAKTRIPGPQNKKIYDRNTEMTIFSFEDGEKHNTLMTKTGPGEGGGSLLQFQISLLKSTQLWSPWLLWLNPPRSTAISANHTVAGLQGFFYTQLVYKIVKNQNFEGVLLMIDSD